jgi:predicted nucleic acid-binding protein
MLAPSLWFYEVVNGLVTAVRRGRISSDQGSDALDRLVEVGVGLTDPDAEDCYRTAVDYQIAAYDAAYVALADALGAVLWTGDASSGRLCARK